MPEPIPQTPVNLAIDGAFCLTMEMHIDSVGFLPFLNSVDRDRSDLFGDKIGRSLIVSNVWGDKLEDYK